MAGWNISWESSVPFKHISLFLRVNKEELCDGTKVKFIVSLVILSLWFLEWGKIDTNKTVCHQCQALKDVTKKS